MTENFDFGALIGGIGLFLLGMTLMTEGLKAASGPFLVKALEKSTNTRLKGFFSGFLATAILQSSTATTLLTIGFVNAGILSFAGSLWLIFGANVGTTMTGWLVALIGLKIKVELFALPMVGIGVIFQMINKKTLGALGSILTGFGILFLGIGFLQESFKNVESLINLHAFVGHGIWSLFAFLFAGFFLSVVTQSSTVATMIILTLANTVGLPIEQSAAAVIGANVGTTVTAAFASIGATANAKRAAWAHIIFNIVAGVVAFAILPIFM